MTVFVFTVSMVLSAALLFLVEPMVAKMLLPVLGGAPAVWSTCLVFFQAVLLAGYLYAYAAMKWLGRRVQIVAHITLVLLPVLIVGLLPLHLPAGWKSPVQSNPVPWILAVLLVAVGLPFFALSSSTPLMQRWFASSGHKQAADPYFLYAASNAGSLAGLLAYPLLLEPLLHLSGQSHLWSHAYMLFVAMTMACARLVWGKQPACAIFAPDKGEDTGTKGTCGERLRWIALAFVPSSLMLGVTTALITEASAIPLFWVLPLAIYLISFVLVFAKRPIIKHERLNRWLPFLILFALGPVLSGMNYSLSILMALYLLLLFVTAMVCHGQLATTRPQIDRLTEYYLLISVGGVLGGIFNSILAPVMFHSVIEFPLVLIFAALLRPKINATPLAGIAAVWAQRKDWLLPLGLGLCMLTVILGVAHSRIKPGYLPTVLFFAYSMLWCASFRNRSRRFAGGLAAMLLACSFYSANFGQILATERSFFGVLRVANDPDGKFRYLIHGGTLHGVQSLDPARSREPLAYYTQSGPAGQIFRAQQARTPHGDFAIVGLGAGAMACYLQSGQTLTYYEIDPLVVQIAEDTRYFTFLQQCAPHAKIVLGDARLKLQDAPDAHYGLIILDAFNGDSIPIHLMTREALALYRRKLAPGGTIAFHISSNYLQLSPTLGDLALDAHLVCWIENDTAITQSERDGGKGGSVWVVMAPSQADLANLIADKSTTARWVPVLGRSGVNIWTDDYSNLLSVIKWM